MFLAPGGHLLRGTDRVAKSTSACAGEIDKRYLQRSQYRWGKIRRGGYGLVTWKGDHAARHVHVYRDSRLVVKWDLENRKPMKGEASQRVLHLIAALEAEGLL